MSKPSISCQEPTYEKRISTFNLCKRELLVVPLHMWLNKRHHQVPSCSGQEVDKTPLLLPFVLTAHPPPPQHPSTRACHSLVYALRPPPLSRCPCRAGLCSGLLELLSRVKNTSYLKLTHQGLAHGVLGTCLQLSCNKPRFTGSGASAPCPAVSPGPGLQQALSRHLFYAGMQGLMEGFLSGSHALPLSVQRKRRPEDNMLLSRRIHEWKTGNISHPPAGISYVVSCGHEATA